MQDLGYELRRIGVKKRARGYYAPKANKCTQDAALRKGKPRRSGAFLVNRRTSLIAQTGWHASVAEVAQEAVARARLIPEDVRLVRAKVVADYGVVFGLRRPTFDRVHSHHDPARDEAGAGGAGAGGDVAREVVARDLHAPRAEESDPEPRERRRWSRTRERVVLDGVAPHREVT